VAEVPEGLKIVRPAKNCGAAGSTAKAKFVLGAGPAGLTTNPPADAPIPAEVIVGLALWILIEPAEKPDGKLKRLCTERRMAPPAGSPTTTGFPIGLPLAAVAVSVTLLAT